LKRTLIRLIVLVSLVVNIAHDAVIAIGDRHVSEPVFEYVLEQNKPSHCGHVGAYHSLYHFAAIITPTLPQVQKIQNTKPVIVTKPFFITLFSETAIKPPIA